MLYGTMTLKGYIEISYIKIEGIAKLFNALVTSWYIISWYHRSCKMYLFTRQFTKMEWPQ